jgi:hypothetical protein
MKTEFTMRNAAMKLTVKPNMNEESETARIGMSNINSEFSRGVDASQGGATAPVIINEAEKSALADARNGIEADDSSIDQTMSEKMKNHEQGNNRVFTVNVYHVTDGQGMHRFLSMNSLAVGFLGGIGEFEGILATQFRTFELLGTTSVAISVENPLEVQILDPEGAERLGKLIGKMMAAYPNASHTLEPWLPDEKAKEARFPTPETTLDSQGRGCLK